MERQRAERNRTITLGPEEILHYSKMCVSNQFLLTQNGAMDTVIYGDLFSYAGALPDEFVDLLIVDPPYNLSKKFGESCFKKMSDSEYELFTNAWIDAIKHTLKKNASVYVCCDWKSSVIIGRVLERHFIIRNRITWQREKGRGATNNWKNAMEDIWFATCSPKDYTFNVESVKVRRKVIAPYKIDGKPKDWIESSSGNFRDTCPSNFWDDISIPYWSMPENTDHPTQKPEKLMAKLILASSNEGDLVFDPFLGAGTTAVVAKKLNRHYLGIECEEEYCALAQKRLELSILNEDIQGYSDGVFWERNTLAMQKKQKAFRDKKAEHCVQAEESGMCSHD